MKAVAGQAAARAGAIVAMDARLVDAKRQRHPAAHHDAAPPRLHQRRAGRPARATRSARTRPTRERFWGTSEELRPLTLPPGYGYPTDPGRQVARAR